MQKLDLAAGQTISSSLQTNGYWQGVVPSNADRSAHWQELCAASSILPRDTYAEDASRYRTLNRFRIVVLDRNQASLWEDTSEPAYEQTKHHNPELGGIPRHYERSSLICETNPVIKEILGTFIGALCEVVDNGKQTIFDVNVHHIRYLAQPGKPSRNSPAGFHKDGERFISVHLLDRSNVEGGANRIADNQLRVLSEFTMQRAGECFLIDDEMVWHSVDAISTTNRSEAGTRDILVIDYLPGSPDLPA
jgi:hypothetical protein